MISVAIHRNCTNHIWGYTVTNHGKTDVCAAVSLLTLNTVNGIEALLDEPFKCEYDPEGGFLRFELPQTREGNHNPEVDLLLEVMLLGLRSVEENYGDEIEILDRYMKLE